MSHAEDYKNTIELVAEKYYEDWKIWRRECLNVPVYDGEWKKLQEDSKEAFKVAAVSILNAVNYFEDKTCKDCGYYDDDGICFGHGENQEFKQDSNCPICRTFAPAHLVIMTCKDCAHYKIFDNIGSVCIEPTFYGEVGAEQKTCPKFVPKDEAKEKVEPKKLVYTCPYGVRIGFVGPGLKEILVRAEDIPLIGGGYRRYLMMICALCQVRYGCGRDGACKFKLVSGDDFTDC